MGNFVEILEEKNRGKSKKSYEKVEGKRFLGRIIIFVLENLKERNPR